LSKLLLQCSAQEPITEYPYRGTATRPILSNAFIMLCMHHTKAADCHSQPCIT
jgi:hypothetical protein